MSDYVIGLKCGDKDTFRKFMDSRDSMACYLRNTLSGEKKILDSDIVSIHEFIWYVIISEMRRWQS